MSCYMMTCLDIIHVSKPCSALAEADAVGLDDLWLICCPGGGWRAGEGAIGEVFCMRRCMACSSCSGRMSFWLEMFLGLLLISIDNLSILFLTACLCLLFADDLPTFPIQARLRMNMHEYPTHLPAQTSVFDSFFAGCQLALTPLSYLSDAFCIPAQAHSLTPAPPKWCQLFLCFFG